MADGDGVIEQLRCQAVALKAELDRVAAAPDTLGRNALDATGQRIDRLCRAVCRAPRPAAVALEQDLVNLVTALDTLEDRLRGAMPSLDAAASLDSAQEQNPP